MGGVFNLYHTVPSEHGKFTSPSASLYHQKRHHLSSCVYLDEVDSFGTSDCKMNFGTTSYYMHPPTCLLPMEGGRRRGRK